jgi:formylglycine-generating enzyme required for sulfatase activity
MDPKKRAIAIFLIILVILFAVFISRTSVDKGQAPMVTEKIALKGAAEPEKAKQGSPEEGPGEAAEQEAQESISAVGQPEMFPEPEISAPALLPVAAGEKCVTDTPPLIKKRTSSGPQGMLYIPGGPFTMGSSTGENSDAAPAHRVCVNGFYIDRFEVTNAQFEQFVDAAGYVTEAERTATSSDSPTWRHPFGAESDAQQIPEHPVICVSWNDAQAYARWANKRLPSEAEWEKAARGKDGRLFPWGNTSPGSGANVNVADTSASFKWGANSFNDGYRTTAPVGSFPAGESAYGVEDMAGNVWEWCSDWWDSAYYKKAPADNPVGPEIGEHKVIRGGSWFYHLDGAQATHRMYFRPDGNSTAIGFRCALDVN